MEYRSGGASGYGSTGLSAGMPVEDVRPGTIRHQFSVLDQELNNLRQVVTSLESRIQLPPRPEGVNAKDSGEGYLSGIASDIAQRSREIMYITRRLADLETAF